MSPITSTTTGRLTTEDMATNKAITPNAPTNENTVVNSQPDSRYPANGHPKSNTATAAPTEAPAWTPIKEASAKGFSIRVCISRPLAARAMPANNAVNASGRRT